MSEPKRTRKAVVQANAEFYIELSIDELKLIQDLAECHYDGTCRQSAAADGFLSGWRHILIHCETNSVKSTFRQLDLVLKITEFTMPGTRGADLIMIANLRSFIKELLETANQMSNIKVDFEGII